VDDALKYRLTMPIHFGAMYKFPMAPAFYSPPQDGLTHLYARIGA